MAPAVLVAMTQNVLISRLVDVGNIMQTHTGQRGIVLLLIAMLSCALMACDKKKKINPKDDPGLGVPDSGSGNAENRITYENINFCKLNKLVTKADKSSPEWTVQQLFIAAKKGAWAEKNADKEQAFTLFYAQFLDASERNVRSDGVWGRAVRSVDRYLDKKVKGDFPFRVCSNRSHDGGRRITIMSFDNKKSNPPIVLKKNDEGQWKITSLSPL
jgi:hypothetical protein